MILLTGSSSLKVYIGGTAITNQLPIVATYIDSNSSTFNPQASETTTNNSTPVTVVEAPASGLSRQIKYLSILNTDSTPQEVYVDYYTPSSSRRLFKQSLVTNQKIEFVDPQGFEVIPEAFLTVTGNVTGMPFITYEPSPLLYNHRVAASRSGIEISNEGINAGYYSFGLSGNMYHNITGHTGDLSQHLTGLSVSNELLDQTLVWNTTGWINKYAHAVVYATNAEIDTLNVGEVVYLSGAQGDRASVRRASNLYENTSSKTVGMISQAIASNNPGPVVTLGYVEKLSLGSYSPGDVLWLGDTPGTFTKTKPSAPNHLVFIGVVARANAGNGIAFIRTQNGYELEELHDVKLSTGNLVSGNFLGWNGLYWTNTGLNTGFISGFNEGVQDVIANTLYATSGLAIVYNDSTDQIFISGERATTTTLGLASFNNSNFTVSSGAVSISAVPTGTVTDLNLAIKDQIGNSGFFEFRGGLTGYWNQASRSLVINAFSGAGGASTLDGLTDVDVPSPVSGNYLHYNGSTWITNNIRTGDIANLTEAVQDVAAASLATTSGLAIIYDDVNGVITISGQRASTGGRLGLASFNGANFQVTSGDVSIIGGISTGMITSLTESIQDTIGAALQVTSGLAVLYSDIFGTITISGERATTSTIGLAAFDSNNFTVSSGLVSIAGGIQTGQIVNYGVTTGQVSNLAEAIQDVAAAALVTTSGLAVIYDDVGGTITVSGQRATTSSIGLAAFDSNNFTVSSGLVSISTVPTGVITNLPDAIDDTIGNSGFFVYRGGLTGIWDQPSRTLTLNWISGQTASSTLLDDLTDVTLTAPSSGQVLAYDGIVWRNSGLSTGNIFNLAEAIQDTIAASLGTASGLHIVYDDVAGRIIISGERASSSRLGIAAFNSSNFTVASGVVFLSASGTSTGNIANLREAIQDTVADTLLATSGLAILYDDAANIITISGERATTATLGIASFDSNNFAVSSGFVTISTIQTGQIAGYGVTTGQISNLPEAIQDVIAATLVTTTGITVVYDDANGQIILSGQRATTSSLGIASFDSNNFTVASGLVSISAITTGIITNYGVTTGQITNLPEAVQDIVAASLNTTSGLAVIYNDTTAEIIISGQRATTTNIGLASFNSANFTVASGAVSISAVPTGVITNLPDAIDDTIGNSGFFIFRGGLTGVWSQGSRALTLNWISGKPSYSLADLTDVQFDEFLGVGNILYNDGANWVNLPSTSLSFGTGQITNLSEAIVDQAAGSLIGTTGIAILYDDAAAKITISGQRATTDVPGIASFNSSNFTVASGAVSISAVPTGVITNLPLAIDDTIGNSGFFVFRGGLTGIWDQPSRTLTLNIFSGAGGAGGATILSDLVDVDAETPTSGTFLHYNGTNWIAQFVRTGDITNLAEAVQDISAASLATTSGLAVLYNDTNGIITISGQRATTSSIGLASFNSSDFTLNSGRVSLSNPVVAASESNPGIIEIATDIEAADATDNNFALVPSNIPSIRTSKLDNDAGFIADITAGVINDLSDVTITTPSSGQFLAYDGIVWRNSGLSTGNIFNLDRAVDDIIGNSGFFQFRGGLTGVWNQSTRQLTLNNFSGAAGTPPAVLAAGRIYAYRGFR